jgi:ArsR family transcriptional regulator, arsenate/arsenite/antimonite-responsive transcriptional repressor
MQRSVMNIFKALGDPNRIRIIKMLENRALCMCEIREILQLSNATVSKHLSILRNAGLVEDTKDGKWVNFALPGKPESPIVSEVLSLLKRTLNEEDSVGTDRKKAAKVCRKDICGN